MKKYENVTKRRFVMWKERRTKGKEDAFTNRNAYKDPYHTHLYSLTYTYPYHIYLYSLTNTHTHLYSLTHNRKIKH